MGKEQFEYYAEKMDEVKEKLNLSIEHYKDGLITADEFCSYCKYLKEIIDEIKK